tara:strand:- start:458 stop:697 length:240 start_codon:yes stop_codon:yes gene_type:complete
LERFKEGDDIMKLFRIICLKRSILADQYYVYWQSNRAGYTEKRAQAGIYSSEDLNLCAGHEGDWYASPLSFSESGGYRI